MFHIETVRLYKIILWQVNQIWSRPVLTERIARHSILSVLIRAIYTNPSQTVIAGYRDAIKELDELND